MTTDTRSDVTADLHSEVTAEISDGVAVVTLNRPSARNALNLPMCLALTDTFRTLNADDGVKAVVVQGAGPSFCAGADLKERKGRDAAWVRGRRQASFEAYRTIESCRKPVLTLVHGSVVGSGGEIAMAGDFVYAASNTVFKFPEVHWGTVGATQRLQRVIGKRKAKELLLTNGTLSAGEALAFGLVLRVIDPDELETVGIETARTMAAAPPLSVELTKQAIDLGAELTLEQGIRVEMNAIERNLADPGWKDGVDRFAAAHESRQESDHQ
ncbi:enoyl-CoA hydratase/isomerase family protein [Spelaeicoccus albus]|uniref:Enoyl-CoA hydratase/carnithine racemase n=1 Tax=Spelaeicoccus albus TaxID=1280376 RepID=A0A7Z0A9P1_9MICO|nr:enoyl-CoA hydratase/isomerase family protein [Spelaeicoccus albus]NYI66974.1 enoyl-CoA hydratase/carnithine racemase [Spelaeicoccus albus]